MNGDGYVTAVAKTSNPLYPSNINDLALKSLRRFTENLVIVDKIQKNLSVTIHYPLTETITEKGETWLKMKSVTLIKPERGAYREII